MPGSRTGAAADLAVQLEAPTIDAPGPFTIDFLVLNHGDVSGTTALSYDLASTGTASQEITVPAGGARLVSLTDELFQERAYHFAFSGAYSGSYDLQLAPFFVAWVSFFPDGFAPALARDEDVSLPVELTCLRRHCDFALVAELTAGDGAVFAGTRAMTMSPGEVERTTVAVAAPAGDYALSWHLDSGDGASYFPGTLAGKLLLVRPRRSVVLEAGTACDACTRTPGAAAARLGVTNFGAEAFTGRVETHTGSGELVHAQELEPLAPGGSASVSVAIELTGQPAGAATYPVTLLDEAGTEVAAAALSYAVAGAALCVTRVPDAVAATPEVPVALSFAAENLDDRGAELVATVTLDEVGTKEARAAAAPGETAEVTVELLFPADMPPGTYHGFYELAVAGGGPLLRQGSVAVEVTGAGLTVEATLDKAAYSAGDSAAVTLALAADAGGVLPDVVVRAQYGTAVASRAVAGGDAAAEEILTVALGDLAEARLAYGVYYADGRALWLGTLPIRAASAQDWSVRALADVVAPGDDLRVRVKAEAGTAYPLHACGETVAGSLSGSAATEAIPVPPAFPSGTYGVAFELTFPAGGTASGVWSFDVAGAYLRVERQESDRESASALASPAARRAALSSYAPGDRVEMRLLFVSSAAVNDAALHAWVQAPGAATFAVVEDQPFAIPSGGEEVPVEETLVFAMPDTGAARPHRVVYPVITGSGVLLTTGEEVVDLAGITPVSAAVELDDYPLATEAVRVLATGMVHGAGSVEVWEGDALLATVSVTGEGEQRIALELPTLAPGEHVLRAVFVSGTHREELTVVLQYGTALSDLSVAVAVSAPVFAAGGTVSESASAAIAVRNGGAGDADEAELVLTSRRAAAAMKSWRASPCRRWPPGRRRRGTSSWRCLRMRAPAS